MLGISFLLELTETDKPNETKKVSTKMKIEERKLNEINVSQNTKLVIKENKGKCIKIVFL